MFLALFLCEIAVGCPKSPRIPLHGCPKRESHGEVRDVLPHPSGDTEELLAAPLLYKCAELTRSKQLTPAELVEAGEMCFPSPVPQIRSK